MKIESFSNDFNDVKIASGVYFEDNRGSLKKTMYGDELNKIMEIKEVIMSSSHKNVIRGLHYQSEPYEIKKFVSCVYGEILDVFVNVNKKSEQYKSYSSLNLKGDDDKALLIPHGYAHGYSVLSEFAIVVYLQSENYVPESEINFHPLSLSIDWQVVNPIISDKDSTAPFI